MKLEAAKEARRIVHARVNKVMRAGGLELEKRMSEKTPVATGRARANWNASENVEDDSVDMDATSADVAGKRNENEGIISGLVFTDGNSLLISNGVPYIEQLEAGSSGQAPAGMIVVSVQEVKPILEALAEREGRGE